MFCAERDIQAYRLLYELEAYLRFILRWEWLALYGSAWAGAVPQAVSESVRMRRAAERELVYVDEYASGFFAYLTLSELRDLLAGKVWSERFVRTWPPLEIVKSEFRKLLGVRNKMAHFRPITNRDMRVIGRFAEDLQDWTAPYRGVAEKADLGLESQAGRSRVRAMKAPLNRFAQDGNWNVGIVQGHLQLVVENHQDDDQWFARMCSILHRHGQLFTYSRLRPLKRFDFYISVQETRGRLVESLLRDLAEPPTVSESSDPEHVPSFALPQGEGILQGHVLIPHGFEIPQDLVPI